MAHNNILELAKQGNTQAVALKINCALADKNISAKVGKKGSTLLIFLEIESSINEESTINKIFRSINELSLKTITSVRIYARFKGEKSPYWIKEIDIIQEPKAGSESTNRCSKDSASTHKLVNTVHSEKTNTKKVTSNLARLFQKILNVVLWILVLFVLITLAWYLWTIGFAEEALSTIWYGSKDLLFFLFSSLMSLLQFIFGIFILFMILLLIFSILMALGNCSSPTSSSDTKFKWGTTSDKVWVSSHRRKNGSSVAGHWRRKPK